MKKDTHHSSIELENSIRMIEGLNKSEADKLGLTADNIDSEEGLRAALAYAIRTLFNKNKSS